MDAAGALQPSLATFQDSCSQLVQLHRRQGFLRSITTVFAGDWDFLSPFIGKLNLFCNITVNYFDMAEAENYVSMLPQPKRAGSSIMALSELNASDHNSRSAIIQPSVLGHKRQGSNLPEPAAKRKTLVERAGEPIRSLPAAPRSNIFGVHPPTSFSAYRSTSNTSSSSYRSNSNVSRHTSNSSFSASLGSGLRPPSQTLARPKTALAKDKTTADSRPKTSHGQNDDGEADTNLKSMVPSLFSSLKTRCSRSFQTTLPLPRKSVVSGGISKPGVIARPVTALQSTLTSQMEALSLQNHILDTPMKQPGSPSKLPKPVTPAPPHASTVFKRSTSKYKSPSKYLTRFTNIEALDAEEHYTNFKRMFEDYQVLYKQTLGEVHEAKNANNVYTSTIEKLEQDQISKTDLIIVLKSENETLKYRLESIEQSRRAEKDAENQHRDMLATAHTEEIRRLRDDGQRELENLRTNHREELRELRAKYDAEVDEERSQRVQALTQATTQGAVEKQRQALEMERKEHEITLAKADVDRANENLQRERAIIDDLRKTLTDAASQAASMETTRHALQAKIEYLESDSKSQSEEYADMERRMNAAFLEAEQSRQKLRKEETLRRKLHNQVQELKGNIRVFCRVRPTLPSAEPEESAQMTFPDEEDCKEIEVRGLEEKSSLGKISTRTHPFAFDRVFNPKSDNAEIFEEISQLIQSALDGFNVCIFAYGQTGSGKTYTMSSDDGMIPRALRQIYATSKDLEERGWKYSMEGSFVEVYNEEIRDLLGNGKESDGKKHEIRHDMQKCETTITDVMTINLDSQDQVERILEQAMNKRSVAATSANERSSRSHSVFILKLSGYNSITGERSKGTLNLVDLAGSERLSHSKVEGQRLKETQSINKSLSCLGDVIGALGQQGTPLSAFDPKASVNGLSSTSASSTVGGHIPYRNSKLTYLLQFSLGGNSKTLMFVMVAPEKKCLGETLTSLKFADKVSRTRVGVAKKVK